MALSSLKRRDFLKLLAVSGIVFTAQALPFQAALADEAIPMPTSLMLHSRHHRIFPQILDYLTEEGYIGITYRDLENALFGRFSLPEKPILISIDDLCMAQGNPSFEHFASMKNTLVNYGFRGTFGIITRPDCPQDDSRWAEITTWLRDGIALESHTAYHSNLDNPNFDDDDYIAEIVTSAQTIHERTGSDVRALITPYGSGYNYQSDRVNPWVMAACRHAGLRFIVGISEGREALAMRPRPRDVFYVGRIQPWGENEVVIADSIQQIGEWYG